MNQRLNLKDLQDPQDVPMLQKWPSWMDPEDGHVRGVSETYPTAQLESGSVAADRDKADAFVEFQSDWQLDWPAWLKNLFSSVGDLFAWFGVSGWVIILLIIAVIFLAVIFFILARTDWGRGVLARRQQTSRRRTAVTKEELPFEFEAASLTVEGLWQQAVLAKQKGDYRRAMMFLYSFLLIELDAHQLIRLSRGKTNRDYSRELRGAVAIYPCFAATMEAFERVFFGRYNLENQQIDDLFSQVGRLELK